MKTPCSGTTKRREKISTSQHLSYVKVATFLLHL